MVLCLFFAALSLFAEGSNRVIKGKAKNRSENGKRHDTARVSHFKPEDLTTTFFEERTASR